MTVLAAVCTKVPEGRLAIIFLPMFTFTAGNVSVFLKYGGSGDIFILTVFSPLHEKWPCWRSRSCTSYVLFCWLAGPKSHYCHGHSRNGPGMEVFRSCGTSWGSSLWHVSWSVIDCCAAFSGHLPLPPQGRRSEAGAGGVGRTRSPQQGCFGLAQFHHVRWDMRMSAPHPPQSFVERDPTCNLRSP